MTAEVKAWSLGLSFGLPLGQQRLKHSYHPLLPLRVHIIKNMELGAKVGLKPGHSYIVCGYPIFTTKPNLNHHHCCLDSVMVLSAFLLLSKTVLKLQRSLQCMGYIKSTCAQLSSAPISGSPSQSPPNSWCALQHLIPSLRTSLLITHISPAVLASLITRDTNHSLLTCSFLWQGRFLQISYDLSFLHLHLCLNTAFQVRSSLITTVHISVFLVLYLALLFFHVTSIQSNLLSKLYWLSPFVTVPLKCKIPGEKDS